MVLGASCLFPLDWVCLAHTPRSWCSFNRSTGASVDSGMRHGLHTGSSNMAINTKADQRVETQPCD